MASVLTTSSDVNCGHQGSVSTSGATHKLRVQGDSVLLKNDIDLKAVTNCATVVKNSPSGDPIDAPCTLVTSTPLVPPAPAAPGVSAGEATKLTVAGQPVMLGAPLAGMTNGMVAKTSPQTSLAAESNQSKLTSM